MTDQSSDRELLVKLESGLSPPLLTLFSLISNAVRSSAQPLELSDNDAATAIVNSFLEITRFMGDATLSYINHPHKQQHFSKYESIEAIIAKSEETSFDNSSEIDYSSKSNKLISKVEYKIITMPPKESKTKIPLELLLFSEISRLNRRVQELEAASLNQTAVEPTAITKKPEERVVDEKRRRLVMIAAKQLKEDGFELHPLPDIRYSGLEGMQQHLLVKNRERLSIGSSKWISNHMKTGDFECYRIRDEIWFDALDIQQMQSIANERTDKGGRKRVGYTRRRRIYPSAPAFPA